MIQNVFNSAEVLEETESLEDYEDITNFENIFHDSVLNETETTLTESEEEALAFIAGFIAYREREKNNDTSLGILTKNLFDAPPYAKWIIKLSAG